MSRYLIGFLALIGLTILLVILISTGHNHVPVPHATSLPSYAKTNSEVSLDVAGPIVAPQDFNELSIDINQNSATFNLYQGYDGHVITHRVFNNSQNSYTSFLYALYYAGYEKTINVNIPGNTGLCPTGNRYDFYLKNDGQTVSHTWATNCTSLPQSFGGNIALTLTLFEAQIPDINTDLNNASANI